MLVRAQLTRHFYAALASFVLLTGSSNGSWAQTEDLDNPTSPPIVDKPQSQSSVKKAVQPKAKPFELANDLDELFAQLRKTRDAKLASRISTRIWEMWQTSDSKSVDLLTKWALNASAGRRFGQALDLLDQVIVIRPKYAEAYNQRATLHFMMDNYSKSIGDIERTLQLEPRHYGALSGLAGIQERLEKPKDALNTWYRVLRIYPAMKSAQDAVVRLEEALAENKI